MEETTKVHQDIAAHVAKVAGELGQDFMIISRGDSTLRGHYPLETQLLAEGLADGNTAGPEKTAADNGASAGSTAVDGEIICPFFPEGGRYTMDNIHYVKEQDNLVPAGMTEFARDKTFGYKSSDLTEYVEEKTEGKYHKEDCINHFPGRAECSGCAGNQGEADVRTEIWRKLSSMQYLMQI